MFMFERWMISVCMMVMLHASIIVGYDRRRRRRSRAI